MYGFLFDSDSVFADHFVKREGFAGPVTGNSSVFFSASRLVAAVL